MKLKITLLMAAALFSGMAIHAQQWVNINLRSDNSIAKTIFAAPAAFTATASNSAALRPVEHYYKIKRAGKILTFFGIGCVVAGTVLVIDGANDANVDYDYYHNNIDNDPGSTKVVMGAMGITGGITAIGGGIPMWIIGARRINKYNRTLGVQTGKKAVGLVYNF